MRLGFDVGGTKTDAVAVAPGGEILARLRRPTAWGPEGVIATVLGLAAELAAAVGIRVDEFDSVGIGMPGQVAPGGAVVTHAVNLGVDELDLARALGIVLGIPVRAENDVKAAAVGAYALHGRAHGTRLGGLSASGAMAYLNLGTGVAAGFVRDGILWRGVHGTAGEVGHISVDPHGPLCKCGQRGCIEAFCGGGAIAERWGRPSALPVLDVFDAADRGDPEALVLRTGLAHGVASAVRVIVLSADVDAVILGGGVTALGDRMLSLVKGDLAASAAASPFMRSLRLADRVELLPPGSPAAAVGAALVGASATEQEAVAHG
ncbi:ROK family protein [Microbacterium flavum]|uniref:ROK family protein n=1 Tax=Microbacterium flavum TaxID=415216 RepID=A0ABS5XZ22_9MICO|nr:ROK family protein [Microbacterium flavum]MBT8799326.1 ROK family protein [Microbacterium flavum]